MFLDTGLLERFDAKLRTLGAPIVDAWAPGLDDEEIDAVLLPLGIDLPEEARVWWRWHDGPRAEAAPIARHLFGGREALALRMEADVYASEGETMKEVWGVEKLLSPVTDKPAIYFGCGGRRDDPVPIYTQNDVEAPSEVLASIGELVLAWVDLMDRGVWIPRADGGLDTRWEKVPDSIVEMGIV